MAKQIMWEKIRDNYYRLYARSKQYNEWVYLNDYSVEEIGAVVEQLKSIE